MLSKFISKKNKNFFLLVLYKLNLIKFPVPFLVKKNQIYLLQKKYKKEILIETGTYLGDMVFAQKENFKEIYSIELGKDLVKKAKERFSQDNNIKIIQGDSEKVLKELLKKIKKTCIFWLDAHYSGGCTAKGNKKTPIIGELKSILKHSKENIIIIDDANKFRGRGDYPSKQNLKKNILSEDMKIQEKDNMFIVTK